MHGRMSRKSLSEALYQTRAIRARARGNVCAASIGAYVPTCATCPDVSIIASANRRAFPPSVRRRPPDRDRRFARGREPICPGDGSRYRGSNFDAGKRLLPIASRFSTREPSPVIRLFRNIPDARLNVDVSAASLRSNICLMHVVLFPRDHVPERPSETLIQISVRFPPGQDNIIS